MRPSELRTTAAVLRSLIGLDAEEMRALLGCSLNTIKSLESGRLKLSAAMAAKMAAATGVSEDWLLSGDPRKLPTTPTGHPYTTEAFVQRMAHRQFHEESGKTPRSVRSLHLAGRLASILSRTAGNPGYELALYKAGRMVDELAAEFEEDPTTAAHPEKAISEMQLLLRSYQAERAELLGAMDAETMKKEKELERAQAAFLAGRDKLLRLTQAENTRQAGRQRQHERAEPADPAESRYRELLDEKREREAKAEAAAAGSSAPPARHALLPAGAVEKEKSSKRAHKP